MLGYFVRHPTIATLVMVAMLALGGVGASGLRVQQLPDMAEPMVQIDVHWPGAAPREVDARIVTPLEPALRALDGVSATASRAERNRARIWLRFEQGWPAETRGVAAAQAVVAQTVLPPDARPPRVSPPRRRDPVVDVVLHGAVAPEALAALARSLQETLFEAGVSTTRLQGVPAPVFEIAVEEAALIRQDVEIADVAAAVAATVRAEPVGPVGQSGLTAVAGRDRGDLTALADAPLRLPGGDPTLRVRDVAVVSAPNGVEAARFEVDGRPAVRLVVERDRDGDALVTQRAVEAAIDALRPELPAGVAIDLSRPRASMIVDRLSMLAVNGAIGAALVLALLLLMLSPGAAVWVAIGGPTAMAACLGAMAAFGVTLDMMSMFALILCAGVVVDDAIVVAERAETLTGEDMAPADAAETAAREMLAPVTAAAATTVIGFAVLLAVEGRLGALLAPIPIVVALVLGASLLECFIVLPAHMRAALSRRRGFRRGWTAMPGRIMTAAFAGLRRRLAEPLAAWAVRRRYAVLAVATGLLLTTAAQVLEGTPPWRFFVAPESGILTVDFAMTEGATAADTAAMLSELRRAADAVDAEFLQRHGVAPIRFALGRLGGVLGEGLDDAPARAPELTGGLLIELVEQDARPFAQTAVQRALESEIRAHPGLQRLTLQGGRAGGGGGDVAVTLRAADRGAVEAAAAALEDALGRLNAIGGLDSSLAGGSDAVTVEPTPLGAALGMTAPGLGRLLRDRMLGVEAARVPHGASEARVLVKLPDAALTRDYLSRGWVRAEGRWTRLSEVATLTPLELGGVARRENGALSARVSGEFLTEDPAGRAAAITRIERDILPVIEAGYGVRAEMAGLRAEETAFQRDVVLATLLGLAGVYAVLCWTFGSWLRPVAVMLTIPFCLVAVVWGHVWWGAPLSMFSVVGALGMAGIAINGAIVLASAAGELVRRQPAQAAIAAAAGGRFRAVTLTTATTVAGLAPLLMETSRQAELIQPAVISLTFGLLGSMAVTLAVTPALLAIEHDVTRAARALRRAPGLAARRRRRREAARGAQPPPTFGPTPSKS